MRQTSDQHTRTNTLEARVCIHAPALSNKCTHTTTADAPMHTHTFVHTHARKHTRMRVRTHVHARLRAQTPLTCTHVLSSVNIARKASAEGKFKVSKKLLAPAEVQVDEQRQVRVHVSVCAHLCEHARRRGPNDCALGRFLLLEIQQKTRASARTRAICVLIAWSDVCARTRTHACACLTCLQHLERMARKQKTLLNAAAASMHV